MNRSRSLALALLAHGAVLVAAFLSVSPLTALSLFVADALLAFLRIFFERLAAGRPQTGQPPVTTPYNLFENLHAAVADTRGCVRSFAFLPPVYPRNVPYVVESCVVLYPLLPLAFPVWLFPVPAGTLSPLAVPALALVAAKHVAVVRGRNAAGVYRDAAPRSVRRNRGFLALALLSGFAVAVLSVASPTPAAVIAGTATVALPWLLFDARQAGFGPWLPRTEGDAVDRPLSVPEGRPRATFAHDSRAVVRNALGGGLVYALFVGLSVALPTLALAVPTGAYRLPLVMAVLLPAFVVAPATALVLWTGEGRTEYRLHDNAVVAYDTYLGTAQWVVPARDIRSVSAVDPTPLWRSSLPVLPDADPVLRIERRTGEDTDIRRLEDPEAFERAFRAD